MSEDNKTDVFNFMSLRSPQLISASKLKHFYIHDEIIPQGYEQRIQRQVFSNQSNSEVGKIVFENIFSNTGNSPEEVNQEIIQALIEILDFKELNLTTTSSQEDTLVNELEKTSYIRIENKFYLLPSKLEAVLNANERDYLGSFLNNLIAAKSLIEKHCHSFNRKALFDGLNSIFSTENLVDTVFYSKHFHELVYAALKAKLFDTLYLLYILRRKVTVNLEEIISGLQALHVLEYLAIDNFLYLIYTGKINPNTDSEILRHLNFYKIAFPEIANLKPSSSSNRFYFIKDKTVLQEFFQAQPMVHPIVGELGHYGRTRFNNIKPYLGDLKVVKQWLLGYKVGEISFIHNVMKGEEKERNHRYLEKTEEIFSFSSDNTQSTQTENGSTERFELKREAEKVIKTDINVGANANMTYKYGDIFTATAGANFAYANSNQESQKAASNYAREVMNKAVTNIQSRTTSQRSVSKLFETEENNIHKITNTQTGATHISGIYRWLDKKYKAQLYNFGQRWMFEFTIPEPAAFYVSSKMKAAEFEFPYLEKPESPKYSTVKIIKPETQDTELKPDDINKEIFNKLRLKYDLEEIDFPVASISFPFSDPSKKNELKADVGNSGDRVWTSHQYTSKIPEGYRVTQVSIVGNVKFMGFGEPGITTLNEFWEKNKLLFMLNGQNIKDERGDGLDGAEFHKLDGVVDLSSPLSIPNGEVTLELNFQDLHFYSLMFYLILEIDPSYLLKWQTIIYNKIRKIEEDKVNKNNLELELEYKAQLADYNNKYDDLTAKVLNDIIQGRSETSNSQNIAEELKKHCITMIAQEFDISLDENDILSTAEAIEDASVKIEYDKFIVKEVEEETGVSPNIKKTTKAFAGFDKIEESVAYPKINIEIANQKARYIQFLEQAFEWQHLAYVFQPYFWAHESKWIKLMNRLDYTDSNMTAFLKAGSARVVIAVTPGYYNAVMHFLTTREPWEGGPLPVIGDPLFVPIYEEIKNKQDDLQNATPEGDPWEFELPTSLIYLQDSSSSIPEDLLSK